MRKEFSEFEFDFVRGTSREFTSRKVYNAARRKKDKIPFLYYRLHGRGTENPV